MHPTHIHLPISAQLSAAHNWTDHENLHLRYHAPGRHAGRSRLLFRRRQALIAQKLDELGIDYIEGGWPGSNPKDKEFFSARQGDEAEARAADRVRLHALREEPRRARTATCGRWSKPARRWSHFRQELGSARRARAGHHRRREPAADLRDRALSEGARQGSGLRRRAFLRRLHANPRFRAAHARSREDRPAPMCCACATPTAARSPHGWSKSCAEVRKRFDGVLGIHTHNDSDVAVANTSPRWKPGCTHVQGCMNGYGERCGNANLASIIANLELKLGHTTIGRENAGESDLGRALHRRTGQSAAAQRSAVRGPAARSRTKAACTSAPC